MSNYTVVKRSRCRLCSSSDVVQVMHFEAVPFFDEVVVSGSKGQEFNYPMALFFCNSCLSLQTQHDVNFNEYYESYQYIASNSAFIKNYMAKIVNYCINNLGISHNDKVIEIGSADGYLLSLFQNEGLEVLGFEAANNLCEIASNKGVSSVNALFGIESFNLIPPEFHEVELLVLLHTFDHLSDPEPFMDTVRLILNSERGVLLLEVHDLDDIYAKHESSLFGHEHAIYLHYGSIKRFLERNGFRILDFNFIPKAECRGSSMLVAATLEGSELISNPNLNCFENPKLDNISTYTEFQASVARSFLRVRTYVETNKREKGRRFAGYGGWGRAITTLAMAGLDHNHLEFMVDSNSQLHGLFTPISGLKIVGREYVTRDFIDEIIVFNYGYYDEICKIHSEFIASGGRIVSVIDVFFDLCR